MQNLDDLLAIAEQRADDNEAFKQRIAQMSIDIEKLRTIFAHKYAQDLKPAAWNAFLKEYPEAKGVRRYDVDALFAKMQEIYPYTDEQDEEEEDIDADVDTEEDEDEEDEEEDVLPYTDTDTGLMWARNEGIACGCMDFLDAMKWVTHLNYCGYSDWRLPTVKEISFVRVNRSRDWFYYIGFTDDDEEASYWTSDISSNITVDENDSNNVRYKVVSNILPYDAREVIGSFAARGDLDFFKVYAENSDSEHYIWPVRGEEIVLAIQDDLSSEYLEADVDTEEEEDFLTDSPENLLPYTDSETGLMWPRNGCIARIKLNMHDAMYWVKQLNHNGYSDWRLPTVEEFAILRRDKSADWFYHNGFINVNVSSFRTSSVYENEYVDENKYDDENESDRTYMVVGNFIAYDVYDDLVDGLDGYSNGNYYNTFEVLPKFKCHTWPVRDVKDIIK